MKLIREPFFQLNISLHNEVELEKCIRKPKKQKAKADLVNTSTFMAMCLQKHFSLDSHNGESQFCTGLLFHVFG